MAAACDVELPKARIAEVFVDWIAFAVIVDEVSDLAEILRGHLV